MIYLAIMMHPTKYFILAAIFILLAATVSAVTITPDELSLEDVLNDGYAEEVIEVSSDSPVEISLSATEPIDSWISFEPISASASKDFPAKFKVIIRPSGARLGIYQGYIIINTASSGNEITSSIPSATSLETTIEITDQEIIQAAVEAIIIKDVEQGSPIKVSVTVQNQGNIVVSPFFRFDTIDENKNQTLKSLISDEKAVFPSRTDIIELDVTNDLALGPYLAQITILLGEEWIIGKRSIKFNVVEPGTLHSEEEIPVISKREKPVPLSASGIVLFVWFILLLVVVRVITKHRMGKKE